MAGAVGVIGYAAVEVGIGGGAVAAPIAKTPHRAAVERVLRCPGARKAVHYYRAAYARHRRAQSLPGPVPFVRYDCRATVRRAAEWRERAGRELLRAIRYRRYQYDWRSWLPRHWYRVGSCETGYGGDPNWRHSNGSYQGAFGFAISSWDGFVRHADPKAGPYPAEAWQATPRQQYEVALAIYRRYGMSGWGCKG